MTLSDRLSALPAEQRALLLKRASAQLSDRRRPDTQIPRRSGPPDRADVSYLQEQLWFLDQLAPGQSTYNVPSVFRLRGPLDVVALRGALSAIVDRHDTLRTTFGSEGGEPFQRIAEPGARPFHLTVDDVSDLTEADQRRTEAARRADEEIRRPFDLESGPLIRALLVRLDEHEHTLAVTMHHTVSDGWSQAVLTGELSEFYAAAIEGRAPSLPELTIQYGDFAHWQREQLTGDTWERQLDHWQQHLAGVPTLELPTDRGRPQALSYRSAAVSRTIGKELLDRVRKLSSGQNTTLFMTLMAAYQVVLARYSGQDEVVVGTTTAGREPSELEPLIGHFVNMVVLRTEVGDDPTFRDLLARVRGVVLQAWRNQSVPFEKVVERVQPARDPSRNPLFQVGLQLLGSATQGTEPRLPGLDVTALDANPGGHPFDLSVTCTEAPDQLRLVADYSIDLFDEPRMSRLLGHLERVLAAAADNPDTRLSELPLLDDAERAAILESWQGPRGERSRKPVHVQIAEKDPALVAARMGDEELTFGELNRRAGVLAAHLRKLGTGRDDVVGLLLQRGFDLLVGMVAAQKAGGAFVVMDPGHPRRRIEFILADTAAKAVVVHSSMTDRLPEEPSCPVIEIDTDWAELESAAEPVTEVADENSLAYILYTSGSTGKPKGVMIEHHALNTFLLWLGNVFHFGPGDRLLQHMAPIFDFAEGEIFTALTRGVTMVFVPEEHRTDPEVIGELLSREKITYIGGPPAILGRIPPAPYPDLKYMIAGGEAVTGDLINRWNTGERRFINGYGPTEAAVGCIFYECEHRTWTGQPPIGRAMPNRVAYVVDQHDNLQPVGVPGEVVTGGEGLARGYLNRPELTDEKFVPDPYRPGEKMYRTGDLGMWSEDGQILFLGRIDTQVKLNGLRIELEEIESALTGHELIAEAAVALREDTPGSKRLVGYYVPAGPVEPDVEQLRTALLEDLPPYMVPHAFVSLPALPLTAVGKVDRKQLPAPGTASGATEAPFIAPRTPAEEKVAAIFGDILGSDRVAADASFFELGGNSLQAARVLSRITELGGTRAGMRDFYASPRVDALARLLPEEMPVAEAPDPARSKLELEIAELEERLRIARSALAGEQARETDGRYPLSPAQEQLWFLEQLAPGSATYNIPLPVRLTGPLDVDLLRRALAAVVERHEALRTTFGAEDDVPYQIVRDAADLALPVTDLAEGDLESALRADAEAPFDLVHEPALRARLLRLDDREHVLSIVMHHISSDGWSAGVLMRDLGEIYDALRHGRTPDLPAPADGFPAIARRQRDRVAAGELDGDVGYWVEKLADAPVLDLPSDRPRPAVSGNRGALLLHHLDGDTLRAMQEFGLAESASTYAVLLTGLQAVLLRYTGETDLVVGTANAGRTTAAVEDVVGFFVNMLALRTDQSGDPSFREALHRTMNTLMDSWDHQEAPFERVVQGLGRPRDASRNPVFQLSLDLLGGDLVDFRIPGLVAEFLDVDPGVSRFDMAVNAYEEPDGITFRIEYSTELFDADRVTALFRHLGTVLRSACALPDKALSQIPLIDEDERRDLVALGEGERIDFPPRTLLDLFSSSLAAHPENPAVVAPEGTLTYAELDERSRRLAAGLRASGVRPGDVVPVLLDRGLAEIVGVLAVLRAGAAYAPLDTAAPAARLAFQVRDTGGPVLLTDNAHSADFGVPVVHVDAAGDDVAFSPDVTAGSLAYVLYTSGSTGEPKGVLIEHGMVVNYLAWMVRDFGLTPGSRMLHCCAPVFDLAVGEIFGALASGAAIVVAGPDDVREPGRLQDLVVRERATHSFTTPTVLQLVAPDRSPELRHVMVAGEAAPPALVDAWNVDGRQVLNLYGPAETTIGCTWYECPPASGSLVPIGKAMPNRRVRVVDPAGDLAPVGVPGELVIEGAGVARGYLNRPDLTAASFVDGGYRSGDLVRWNADGQLEFLGRRDGQIKLRGLRVELGEVEHALAALSGVRQAAATVHGDALVGYVVGEVSGNARALLATTLPSYMVPGTIVNLDELPLTRTGKVDRKRLPAPDQAPGDAPFEEPAGDLERDVAAAFAAVLGLERVGRNDDFFARGGNSLQAIRAVSRLTADTGQSLTVRDFYAQPTVAALAVLLDRADWALLESVEGLSDEEVERLLAAE